MDGLSVFIDKLSHYSFVTNILPGAVLCIILKDLIGYDLFVTKEWYLLGIIFYFVGIVCNRFGSVCVEPLLKPKRTESEKRSDYTNFMKAEQLDSKVITLNTENNVFRSYVSVCALSVIALGFRGLTELWPIIAKYQAIIVLVLILVLFVFSYRKQTKYVRERVEILTKKK